MANQLKLRLLLTALSVLLAVLSVACGGGDGAADVASTPAAAAAPSLEVVTPPTRSTDAVSAAVTTDAPDAPEFPEVTPSEPLAAPPKVVAEDLKVIWEAWQHLHNDYVEKSKLDPEAFTEAAIRGMLRVLEDTQTSYVSPEVMATSFGDLFKGNFQGIGAHVSMNLAGELVIVAPIEGSPAEAAGIRPGDKVLAADGESLEGLSLLEAVAKIRGPEGTIVTLLVKHLGALDPVEIKIKRGVIPLVSVLLRSEADADFAHIRISNFYPTTVDDFRNMVLKVMDGGAKGLIVDLRSNPGGTLDSVVQIASEFLADGLVLYDVDGNGRRTEWKVRRGGIAMDIPMVVLINEGSASSSEVLAGALQDHNRAKVIGATSFGKGSINILRTLSNGAGLYITISHWYTPLGRLIQDEGITPDIEVVSRDAREADVKQLERAIEELERMTGA